MSGVTRQAIIDAMSSTMVVNRTTTGDPADEWSWQENTVIYVERAADAVMAAIERNHVVIERGRWQRVMRAAETGYWWDGKEPADLDSAY